MKMLMSALLLPLLLTISQFSMSDGLAVIAIDLGSEFMKIALVKPGVPMEIVLNKESKRKTPVAVAFRNGERTFGDEALITSVKYPEMAYIQLRELLGKTLGNPQVQKFHKTYPFYSIEEDKEASSIVFNLNENTSYRPEELVAMVLEKAKELADAYAEQPINDVVITVPSYFNQAERRAVMRAGEIAGLKVLQLMNENTAVALNYGVFRMKEFNNTAINIMFFNMGSRITTASIVAYQVVKTKNAVTGILDTHPQLTVKGVGYNRALGGYDFQLRLRDHLARAFNEQKKTKTDVFTNKRAMAKLMKEAGRVMHVLSANTHHFAQIEGLLDDKDFKHRVTREEFEEMNSDLFEQVDKVVEEALLSSQMIIDEMNDVILMGGGTRIPRVQEQLKKAIKRQELGKSINTDEAAALGAVYQAAHLSKGFKVKKFVVKDANQYPIQVEFQRAVTNPNEEARTVKRLLFGKMNSFPQKKVMTFNKHVKDFNFVVNYAELDNLSEDEQKNFGSNHHLQQISLTGVETAHSKQDENTEPKGVKAHFRMDDSGILTLDRVEAVFERAAGAPPLEEEESTLSKLGNTISNLFGSSTDDKKEAESKVDSTEEAKKGKKSSESPDPSQKSSDSAKSSEKQQSSHEKPDKSTKDKTSEKSDEKTTKESSSDEDKKSTEKTASDDGKTKPADDSKKKNETEGTSKNATKPSIIREEIEVKSTLVDLSDPAPAVLRASKKRVRELKEKDLERAAKNMAVNELESFVFDTQDKLYQTDYEACSTEPEREKLIEAFRAANDWMFDQSEDASKQVYQDKLAELQSLTRNLFDRVREKQERPKALEALRSMLNYSTVFADGMHNFTGENQPFTEVELNALTKLIDEIKVWKKDREIEQATTPDTEPPKLLLRDIATKMQELDREVKYLINKAKYFVPKKPDPVPASTNDTDGKSAEKPKSGSSDSGTEKEGKSSADEEIVNPTSSPDEKPSPSDSASTEEIPTDQTTQKPPETVTDEL